MVQSYSPGGANVHRHLTHASLDTPESKWYHEWFIVLARLTAEGPYTSQRSTPPRPSKLPLRIVRSRSPSNTWFLGLTQVHNPNGILIGSAVLAGLTTVTDRQTDHATMYVVLRCSVIMIACLPMPWCVALSDRNSGSCIRWAPLNISSPRMNMSYELEYFYTKQHHVSSYTPATTVPQCSWLGNDMSQVTTVPQHSRLGTGRTSNLHKTSSA